MLPTRDNSYKRSPSRPIKRHRRLKMILGTRIHETGEGTENRNKMNPNLFRQKKSRGIVTEGLFKPVTFCDSPFTVCPFSLFWLTERKTETEDFSEVVETPRPKVLVPNSLKIEDNLLQPWTRDHCDGLDDQRGQILSSDTTTVRMTSTIRVLAKCQGKPNYIIKKIVHISKVC